MNVGELEVIADPFAGRLRAARAPTGITRHRDAGLLKLRRGFGRFDIAEIENGKRRGAGLRGIQDQAGESERVQQARGDGPCVAELERVRGLVLADLVSQQRLVRVPARIGVVDAEIARRDLMRAGVVIDLGQELLVVGRGGLRVEQLAGGVVAWWECGASWRARSARAAVAGMILPG